MKSLTQEILSFLQSNGFDCSIRTCNGLEFICTYSLTTKQNHTILPLSIEAGSVEEASCLHENTKEAIRNITSQYSEYPLIVTEDRWHLQPEAMQKRILAHLEIFNPIYARNCEVRRIDKALAKVFLEANHSYGHAACRYCYGMFLKRHTGHIAQQTTSYAPGTLVAVATFSNARKWSKGDKIIRSYEWTRYASLPDVRLSGGMGRMREVCGTVSGMTFLSGLICPADDPSVKTSRTGNYALVQDMAEEFRKINGSIVCRELLGLVPPGSGIASRKESPEPSDRTPEYYKKRPCEELVGISARIIGEKINNSL